MYANIKHEKCSYFYKIVKISIILYPYYYKKVKISIIYEIERLISTENNREIIQTLLQKIENRNSYSFQPRTYPMTVRNFG